MTTRTISLLDIAAVCGHRPGPDGRLNLPNDQATADSMATAARRIAMDGRADWRPGDPPVGDIVLTGAGPIWAYLCVAHGLHGIARSLTYSAPAGDIRVWGHGTTD